ncbi:hypothetical protein Bca4012_064099 [Brassica carinata]|uniref:DUF7086 domain-containing protein n=1 Tax=Brassica carinata TaxID=52824 RepID=A0A8X7V7K0_BRACI|nr:hypothetical protein Bca52824_033678 [Brassica carinata]
MIKQTKWRLTILDNGDGAQADDDDDDAHLPLSLSLGQTSNPSPNTTALLRLAPPSHVVPPMRPHDFMARLASRGSSTPMQPPLLKYFLPSLGYIPSSNQTPARPVMRTITSKFKDDTIPPPFPWATNERCTIQSLENLESKQITTITEDVQYKHCEKVYEVNGYERTCELCGLDKAVKPVIAEPKGQINWLFLLLGQTLGYCTLEKLLNFCKSPRTGAKDRVLYLTYLDLYKML